MKKIISIIMTLVLTVSLAACTGGQTAGDGTQNAQPPAAEQTQNSTVDNSDSALPMNIGEAYTCSVGGYEGYVAVTNYEIVPDEMNEGCEVRTAYITAVFPGAPKSLDVAAVAFPASGEPEAIDETAWVLETEYGEVLIFEYDNISVAETTDGDVLRYDFMLSYMVPETYDEISLAVTDGSMDKGFDMLTKADMVFSDTCWFLMGSMDNGVLTYNGNAVATAAGNADINQIYGQGTPPAGWADSNIPQDEYYEEEYYEETETPGSASGYRTLELIQFNAITEATSEGRTISFGAIELVECYEDTNVINVTVNYSGHHSGDVISALLFDAYNEVHLDEQNEPAIGSGSVTFAFSCPAATAPYTFSIITLQNGSYVQNNIHIDADVY